MHYVLWWESSTNFTVGPEDREQGCQPCSQRAPPPRKRDEQGDRSPLVSVLSSVWKAEAGRASHLAVAKDVSLPVFVGRMWSPEQVRSPLAVHSGAWLLPSIYERAMLAGDRACDRGQGAWLLAMLTPRSNVVKWPRKQPSWEKAETNLPQRTLGLNEIRTLLFYWNHQLISNSVLEFWGWG